MSELKSLNTNLAAFIKTINGNPIANVKTYNGLTSPVSSSLLTGLVSYYKFDTNANDSLGIYNGTVINATLTTGSGGKINECYTYGSGDTRISLGNMTSSFTTEGSLSVWLKAISPYNGMMCWILGNAGDSDHFPNSGSGDCYLGTFSSTRKSIGSPSITFTDFNHVVITSQPGASNWKCYINGTLFYSGTGDSNIELPADAIIGKGLGGAIYNGLIDEVGFWNRAITSGEVTQLYNSGNGIQYPF